MVSDFEAVLHARLGAQFKHLEQGCDARPSFTNCSLCMDNIDHNSYEQKNYSGRATICHWILRSRLQGWMAGE